MDSTVVTTALGPLVGTERSVAGRLVRAFLGIPYAVPPVGSLRFRAPIASDGWTGARDATRFGAAAPQLPGTRLVPGDETPEAMDEDCLFLNVWAPEGAGPRPVLVWLHGGGFLGGTTADPTIDGARLAARGDVVVVSVGYRVGALGFLALGDSNCGLRDQLLALRWVQDHIAAFGGDPANVTLFGESAGGGSALHLLVSPHSVGLFRRAIVQSGATSHTRTQDQAGRATEVVVDALEGEDPFGVPWPRIVDAQLRAIGVLMLETARMPFHPALDDDVVPVMPLDALRAGAGADVDLVIGTTRDEMRLFLDVPAIAEDKLLRRVGRYLGRDASSLVRAYREIEGGEPIDCWAALFTDHEMLLPAVAMADAHAGRTFRYLFAWEVEPRADGLPLRSCHAADLPFTFGTLDRLGWDRFTAADREPERAEHLVATMQDAWCAFARHGASPGWPEHESGRVLLLGPECAVVDDPSAPRLAAWAAFG